VAHVASRPRDTLHHHPLPRAVARTRQPTAHRRSPTPPVVRVDNPATTITAIADAACVVLAERPH